MPEFCTCGAKLPADALFCHRCGKPQRELAAVDTTDVPPPPPPPSLIPPAVEISFRNRLAVRIGLLVGAVALLVNSVPISPYLTFFWMTAAGLCSVYLYNRRTGQVLSVRNGARIGWMTGVFTFLISFVLITLMMVLIAGQTEAIAKLLQEQSNLPKEMTEKALQVLRNPGDLFASLLVSFFLFSVLSALGGALGARVFSRH